MLYYLKIENYPGESTAKDHENQIEVQVVSWGLSQSLTVVSPSNSTARATFQDVDFEMRANRSSGALMLACAQGTHLKDAVFFARKEGSEAKDILEIKLSDVLISSISDVDSDEFLQRVSLNYGKIEYRYKRQLAEASLEDTTPFAWNVKENNKA
jgi:type VI secretion system secreted protein Hcp